MASSSRTNLPPELIQEIENEMGRLRVQFTKMGFALDEAQAENQRLRLQNNRLQEKHQLLYGATTTMLAEKKCVTILGALIILRGYAQMMRVLLDRNKM